MPALLYRPKAASQEAAARPSEHSRWRICRGRHVARTYRHAGGMRPTWLRDPVHRLSPCGRKRWSTFLTTPAFRLGMASRPGRRLNLDSKRIVVRGVGGGLAAGLALRASQLPDMPIKLLFLLYPMLDDRTGAIPFAGDHVWTPNANRFGWNSIRGAAAGDPPHAAAPARIPDLSGFPPTFIAVGAIDLLWRRTFIVRSA